MPLPIPLKFLCIIAFFGAVQLSYAQPSNDDYADAIDVTTFINSCSADALYTTVGATGDGNAGSNWGMGTPSYNVWFRFTAPGPELNLTIDIDKGKGSQRFTQVALWQADGLTEVKSERPVYGGPQ